MNDHKIGQKRPSGFPRNNWWTRSRAERRSIRAEFRTLGFTHYGEYIEHLDKGGADADR